MDIEKIKNRFINFAESECKNHSELYYELSLQVSKDEELLSIASHAKSGQPIPNIFLAAVHYLLLKCPDQELAKYYPSIQKVITPLVPFQLFKTFCIDHYEEIKTIISTRIVQSNVINRCSYLMPIFSNIIAVENRPTTIIDIGTSSGLTLNFDKYEYWYNGTKAFGESKVINKSNILGAKEVEICPIVQPLSKIGIDQHIIDPTNPYEILWLKALVWPDQQERFDAIDAAFKLEDLKNVRFLETKTISDFERIIVEVDRSQAIIIYATHVLYQFSLEERGNFYSMLERVGQRRDFYFLSVESLSLLQEKYNTKNTVIELTRFKDKKKTVEFLGETNGHGNWIKWLDNSW
jgi:hypothetical protein